jgi:hypothetical protein
MGKAHSKLKNTVNDIQEKYKAIRKLEEVSAKVALVAVCLIKNVF